jgi:DNA invertase Pin-like site-specific DNA recombinase/uncharacterized small protein (DUF1192 family)
MNASLPNAVWAYLVVSSEQQAETLDHQEAWALDVARDNNWKITQKFRGVSSGRDGTRKLLEQLLTKLRDTPRDVRPARVLMIRLDRLGRGLGLEAVAAIAEISKLGVVIHTRQDGDYTLHRASDSLLPLMRVVTGAIENEARRDKAKAVYARRRAKNETVGNKRPYGLQLVGGKDEAQEPQAAVVRLAYELARNGYGLAAIGARLRPIAPQKLYVNGRKHTTEWTTQRVSQLLRNRSYCGTLIESELWHDVQALRAGAPRTRAISKHPWPLSGAIHCSCGRLLIGSMVGSSPRRVYRCAAKSIHGRSLSYSALKLEVMFGDLLDQLIMTEDLAASCREQLSSGLSVEAIERRITECKAEIDRTTAERKRAWDLNERGMIVDMELARRLREIDARLAQLYGDQELLSAEERRAKQQREDASRAEQLVARARDIWLSAEIDGKRSAAQALARAVGGLHIHDGNLAIGTPSSPSRFIRTTISTD